MITLLEQLRTLRIDPVIMSWAEDCDVMWLPKYSSGRIFVDFYSMEKKNDAYLLKTTGTKMELAWPELKILKLERSNNNLEKIESYCIDTEKCCVCKDLFYKYHEYLNQFLSYGDSYALENSKKCEKEIYSLLRRVR